jgi:hypothetical protein
VERHHRALAEPDDREIGFRELVLGQLRSMNASIAGAADAAPAASACGVNAESGHH